MADNITFTTTVATPPSGTVAATDEIGGVQYQRVKLSCGPDGTATDVPVGGGVEAAALRVTIASDSTGVLSIDDNGGSLTVDGTVTATIAAGATTIAKAEDVAHTTGDVGVMALSVRSNTAAATSGTDGDYQPLITDTNGRLHVIQSAGTAGDVAHDSADSGNPVKLGGVARQTNPTAVTDGDRVNLAADDVGRQVVVLNQPRDLVASQVTTISNSTSETTIVTAIASTFCDLTHLTLTNATATAVVATLKDATGGTTRGIYALAANGGITLAFPTPKAQASANNNWTITLSALSITVYVVAEYVKNV